MTLALRFINSDLNWEITPEDKMWLLDDEIPADPLSDLKTKNNTLSVYFINDDKADLTRCVSAYASARDKIVEIHCVIFDVRIVQELKIEIHQSEGNLSDEYVNKIHRNLIQLSSQKLVNLAIRIINENETYEFTRDQVYRLIHESLEKNWLDPNKIPDKLKSEYEDFSNRIKGA
jgi:hypothetical protein